MKQFKPEDFRFVYSIRVDYGKAYEPNCPELAKKLEGKGVKFTDLTEKETSCEMLNPQPTSPREAYTRALWFKKMNLVDHSSKRPMDQVNRDPDHMIVFAQCDLFYKRLHIGSIETPVGDAYKWNRKWHIADIEVQPETEFMDLEDEFDAATLLMGVEVVKNDEDFHQDPGDLDTLVGSSLEKEPQ